MYVQCIYIYICITTNTYLNTFAHISTLNNGNAYFQVYTFLFTFMPQFPHMYIYIYIHVFTSIFVYIQRGTHIYIYIHTHMHLHLHMDFCMHTYLLFFDVFLCKFSCLHFSMPIKIFEHTYLHKCTFRQMPMCIHNHGYMYYAIVTRHISTFCSTYVCNFVYIHIYTKHLEIYSDISTHTHICIHVCIHILVLTYLQLCKTCLVQLHKSNYTHIYIYTTL